MQVALKIWRYDSSTGDRVLRDYEFEMAQPADSYRDDTSKMVIQLARPATVRYKRRSSSAVGTS